MGTGTLVQAPELIEQPWPDNTLDVTSKSVSSEDRLKEQVFENISEPVPFYMGNETYFASPAYLNAVCHTTHTTPITNWDTMLNEIMKGGFTIWDTPKLQSLLVEPVGAPIDLTFEEANEIVKLAAGRRHDLPPGKDVIKEVREVLGHSLMKRLKKAD